MLQFVRWLGWGCFRRLGLALGLRWWALGLHWQKLGLGLRWRAVGLRLRSLAKAGATFVGWGWHWGCIDRQWGGGGFSCLADWRQRLRLDG